MKKQSAQIVVISISTIFLILSLIIVGCNNSEEDSNSVSNDGIVEYQALLSGDIVLNEDPTEPRYAEGSEINLVIKPSLTTYYSNGYIGIIDELGNAITDPIFTAGSFFTSQGDLIVEDEKGYFYRYNREKGLLNDYTAFQQEQNAKGRKVESASILEGFTVEHEDGLLFYDYGLNLISKDKFDHIDIPKHEPGLDLSDFNYYAVKRNEKYGAITISGNYILEPIYDELKTIEYSIFQPMENTWLSSYLISFRLGEKWGLANSEKVLLQPNYDCFYDGAGCIIYELGGKYGLMDVSGQFITSAEYEDVKKHADKDRYAVKKNGYWGLIDGNNNPITAFVYNDIKMHTTDIYLYKDGQTLIYTADGKNITLNGEYDTIFLVKSNMIEVWKDGKAGIIDKDEKEHIPINYKSLNDIAEKYYIAQVDNNSWHVLDQHGQILYTNTYSSYPHYGHNWLSDDVTTLIVEEESGKGLIAFEKGKEARFVLPCQFKEILYSSCLGEDGYYNGYIDQMAAIDYEGRLYFLNASMQPVFLGYYDDVRLEEISLLKFEDNNTKTLLTVSKNGKYGVIDNWGNIIIDFLYEDMDVFNSGGFAAIKLNGLWGSIDCRGNVTCSPKYSLMEDRLYSIIFIGSYYCGEVNYRTRVFTNHPSESDFIEVYNAYWTNYVFNRSN